MKSAKKTAANSAAQKAARPTVERVGNLTATNYWVKTGLMREELAALKHVAQLFKNASDQTTGKALHLVVATALLHWDKLEPHVFADDKYCRAEGVLMENLRRDTLFLKYPALKPDGRGAKRSAGKN